MDTAFGALHAQPFEFESFRNRCATAAIAHMLKAGQSTKATISEPTSLPPEHPDGQRRSRGSLLDRKLIEDLFHVLVHSAW